MVGLPKFIFSDRKTLRPNRVHVEDSLAVDALATALEEYLAQAQAEKPPVVVCIGTDRSTGDSLGPLAGSALQGRLHGRNMHVYGTLDEPVHATNLEEVLHIIAQEHSGHPILAIDACLGRSENVGYISLKPGPLKPGTGVNKKLPAVGDFHLVGVVNVGGFMEYFVLQNTRLSLVMRMANTIAAAVEKCLRSYYVSSDAFDPPASVSLLP